MKAINAILTSAVAVLLSGCINLYTRCPGTDARIEDTYQSTSQSIATAYVVAFPQIITGWQPSIEPENFITIPFGLLVLCDTPFEAVVDTVCWPWDNYISDARRVKPNPTNSNEVIHEDGVGEHK